MSTRIHLLLLFGWTFAVGQALAQTGTEALQDASDAGQEKWNAIRGGPKHAAPVDTARIYSINDVEQLPEYPGGMKALYAHIAEHFQYTDTARTTSPGGRIQVQFVVERTGEVGRVKVLRGLDDALDREAVRVISGLPPWTPAKYFGGTPVACRMVLPIRCEPK